MTREAALGLQDPVTAAEIPGEHTARPLPNDANLAHYIYLPPDYATGASFPLIVFLHGAGERGNGSAGELTKVLRHGPPKLIEQGRSFPAIVVSPQTPTTRNWASSITAPFVDYLVRTYKVDPSRIYITGLSLGGEGTWFYGRNRPGIPAAFVPICGPKTGTGYEVLAGKPLWTFHNTVDSVVRISETMDMLQEITGLRPPEPLVPDNTYYFNGTVWERRSGQHAPRPGENPTFTVYGGPGHDAWTAAYNNEEMWSWLFAQPVSQPTPSTTVFQQDFERSTSIAPYVQTSDPDSSQFNDISAEPNGGTFAISQGRLQLARTGSAAADDAAGITRWKDFAGSPTMLHVSLDLGVSGWTATPFQSGAFLLNVGSLSGFRSYGGGDVAASTFQGLSVKGEGPGQFSVATAGVKSPLLAANGTLHRIDLFLNKSGAAADYPAPDGSPRTVQNNGVALWVNGAPVILDAAAANGASSTLTDVRLRWPTGDNGTWSLDNIVVERLLP